MPTVIARIDPDWLPAAVIAHHVQEPRHKFTAALLAELDRMVAQAVSEVDHKRYTPGEVVIYPVRNHPLRKNASTFCFDLQPGEGGLRTVEERARRRVMIEEELARRLLRFFDDLMSNFVYLTHEFPTFDIECRPISSTGSTYVHTEGGYVPAQRWGQRNLPNGDDG